MDKSHKMTVRKLHELQLKIYGNHLRYKPINKCLNVLELV